MTNFVRSLNSSGSDIFAAWLQSPSGAPPREILFDPKFSDEEPEAFAIDLSLRFATSFELGEYLHGIVLVGVNDRYDLRSRNGMWAWLSLAFIESLLSKGRGTNPRPLAAPHYIDGGARLAYRLIARTAWELCLLHGTAARVALTSTSSPWGEMAEQMTGAAQENFSHRAFWHVANLLYIDGTGRVRSGAAGKRGEAARKSPTSKAGLGSARRLAMTMRQFDRTYNTREMSAEEIITLLPGEYSRWRSVDVSPAGDNAPVTGAPPRGNAFA